jgi:tripartite-type tricarboxylate transporter receptor subunit TctC
MPRHADPSRRAALSVGTLALTLAPRARAQAWPERPLRVLVGFPPGAPADVAMRLLAGPLGDRLGQAVVVENRTGASGLIAAEAMLRAPADGHTLLVMPSTTPTTLAMRRAPPFEAAELHPVAGVALAPMVLVARPALGVADMAAFLALARGRGDRLTYGIAGPASAEARAMALLADGAGLSPTPVGYRGNPEIATALLSQQVDCGFLFLGVALPHIREGRLTALATTSPQRVPHLPQLPTTGELGLPEVDVTGAWSVVAPRAMPAAAQATLLAAVRAAREMASYRERLALAGALPLDLDDEALRAALLRERDRQVALLRRLGVEPD